MLCETYSLCLYTIPEMADAFHRTTVKVKSTDIGNQNRNWQQPSSSRVFSLSSSTADFQPTFICTYAIACLIVCHNYLYLFIKVIMTATQVLAKKYAYFFKLKRLNLKKKKKGKIFSFSGLFACLFVFLRKKRFVIFAGNTFFQV